MPIHCHESYDFESLWDQFVSAVRPPLRQPLAAELIVAPGRGWSTWMSRRLADELGCWGQFRFLVFGQWLAETLENVLGPDRAPRREPDSLTWMIARRLPELRDDPDFRDVRNYLFSHAKVIDPQRLIELSRCLGGLFDRYLLDRPDLIAVWEQGDDWPAELDAPAAARWQRKLWASITQEHHYRSVEAMVDDLRDVLEEDASGLPQRVSVWHCGGISPAQLSFLTAIGQHTDIGLYVIVPATEFWGDMSGRREILRKLRKCYGPRASLRQFCREQKIDLLHPLLASQGELSRQQQMLMVDCQAEPWHVHEINSALQPPSEAGTLTLLEELQHDIRRASEPVPRPLPRDGSFRVHSCHCEIREVEVLRDQLREAFETDPQLTPEDVVVLCSSLQTYAPLIQAVFGASESVVADPIPFHTAGRSPRQTEPWIDAYFRLLETLPGRFSVSEVIDLLHIEAIGAAAGLDRDNVQDIADWANDSGIRWGADARHRAAEGLPSTDLNTWEFGIDRLVLGSIMPPGGGLLVGNVVALDRAAGLQSAALGRLWTFIKRLGDWRERIQKSRPLAEWRLLLRQLAECFLDAKGDESALQQVLHAASRIAELAHDGGFDGPVPFAVALREMSRQVDEQAQSARFRVGGVTFTDFSSLRSLPYNVVALLGMNDGAFPRNEHPVRFDLLSLRPRLGDRTSRLTDRHLFLEAILAARTRLIITFQGQGIRDQKPRPPAIVVQELLDALEQSNLPQDGVPSLRESVVVIHPLQAFSPRYFDRSDPRLFSYVAANQRAADKLIQAQRRVPVFAEATLPELESASEMSIDELHLLLAAPWKLFLRRLNVSLADAQQQLDDREPLMVDGLEKWEIGDQWLKQRLADTPTERITARLNRSGQLPAGPLGSVEVESFQRETERLVAAARSAGITRSESLPVSLLCDGILVTGRVPDCTARGVRRVTWSKLSAKRAFALWLDHLLATVASQRPLAESLLIARDQSFALQAMDPQKAHEVLNQFVGLTRLARRSPLPFFVGCLPPKKLLTGRLSFDSDEERAKLLRDARNAFQNGNPALSKDSSVKAAFAGREPLELRCADVPDFPATPADNLYLSLAESITRALMEHIEAMPSTAAALG